MSRRYIDVAAVAERYGYSEYQVYELARACRLPHRKRAGRLLFLEAELDLFDDGAELETRRLAKGARAVMIAQTAKAAR